MNYIKGRVLEIHADAEQKRGAIIEYSSNSIPVAGEYFQATRLGDMETIFPLSLFPSTLNLRDNDADKVEISVAAPIPISWQPGTILNISQPLGTGFKIPALVKKLGLVALGDSAARLMPLVAFALG